MQNISKLLFITWQKKKQNKIKIVTTTLLHKKDKKMNKKY